MSDHKPPATIAPVAHPARIFIEVNHRRVSLATFLKMEREKIEYVDARGCTALTSVDLPAAKTVDASGCTALTSVDLPAAKTVYARGCTALTSVDLPAAEYVDASGCTALTSVDLPAAKTVYARGCTALTSVDLPAAETVYASGCTALTSVDLPAAETVYASGCTALTSVDLPAAKTVYASGVPAIPNFFAGTDSRGYEFTGVKLRDQWFVTAGCRFFDFERARKHWGPGGPSNRADCFALVEKIAAHVAEHDAVADGRV